MTPAISIILAAGEGKRMRSVGRQKVCFEVGGVPIILRALQAYEEAGIEHHIIVVGHHAEQVIAAVGGRHPNTTFAYQPEPLGTGNAVKCGIRVLQAAGYQGRILVVAGDKIIAPRAVRKLLALGGSEGRDLAFIVGEKDLGSELGRVLVAPDGRPLAIVEASQARLSRLVGEIERALPTDRPLVAAEDLASVIRRHFPQPTAARKACGELYDCLPPEGDIETGEVRRLLEPLRQRTTVRLAGEGPPAELSAAEAEERSRHVNHSTYLFAAEALSESIASLSRDNAQREEFLTDAIAYLANCRGADGSATYRLAIAPLEASEDALTFNTPEELAEVERIILTRRPGVAPCIVREPTHHERPLAAWRALFSDPPTELRRVLRRVYGDDGSLLEAKRRSYAAALELAIQHLGPDRAAFVVRSPGRINLMGRHIDHRGGSVNVMAISEEILMVAAPRSDDQVRLHNADTDTFAHAAFSIGQEIAHLDWGDWLTCVNSPKTLTLVAAGSWENYIKAAALRLQHSFTRQRLLGADIVAQGTIPIGSGLSSSSAVVVGAAEALVAANGLDLRPSSLVDLCGEGEWFVGTRGGSADHAAIKFARRGQVAHVSFFPFEVEDFMPFPARHALVVCDSGELAKKSEGARETFNSRILGYLMGELIFKREFPEFAPSIHHLRDITCENLGLGLPELYGMLMRLPPALTESELLERYGPFSPEDTARLANLFAVTQDPNRSYGVRGLVLFGLAECDRARLAVDLLRRGDADALGRLWAVSHDGDRVVRYDANLQPTPFAARVDDAHLAALAAQAQATAPEGGHAAHLHRQPGVYACSTPLIDRIVDLAMGVPGVKGAQIAGAGLGGCAMILAENAAVAPLQERLAEHGHRTVQYFPVEGAGVIAL